jgi:predicted GNAT family N-acyltransferase
MAVLKGWRKQGVGGAILEALVAAAHERGDREVVLSSQTHALEFYRRHGFTEEGAIYEDAGIPHQAMRRSLLLRNE